MLVQAEHQQPKFVCNPHVACLVAQGCIQGLGELCASQPVIVPGLH